MCRTATRTHHKVAIVGGGSAGISVAARLRAAGQQDVAVIDPATTHYYQPLWTLVGGGRAPVEESARPQASVMPKGVSWIQRAAAEIDPDSREITLDDGGAVGYDYLVVPGHPARLGEDHGPVGHARPRRGVEQLPLRARGPPRGASSAAADHWRQQGVLHDIDIHLVLPTPAMFGVKEFSDVLVGVARRDGITVHFESEVTEVRSGAREAVVTDKKNDTTSTLPYDVMHLVPPQSAPDWIKKGPLADPNNPAGYVEIDKHTMQHTRYANVFSLGDAGSSPNSKTGAAIRKQAPVVAKNLVSVMNGQAPTESYGGYASCPLTTARNKMLLAEFDYTMKPTPSIPGIDTIKERTDMWYLKRYGLPALYWNLMLRGRA